MNHFKVSPKWRNIALIALIISGMGLALFLFQRWRRQQKQIAARHPSLPGLSPNLSGLSEAEAVSRLEQGQDNTIHRYPKRTRQQMIRDGALTIFNLNLVGLAFVQILLNRPLDALITGGIMLLNIGVNVFQEEFARFRISELEQTARPQTTVIREGKTRLIDPAEIVTGDLLSAGPGDQIMVDGPIVGQGTLTVDESLITGNSTPQRKSAADILFAGSFCISGQAIYQAEKVGQNRRVAQQLQTNANGKESLTPIEQIINGVMRVLLVIVILLATVLMMRYFRLDLSNLIDDYVDAANVIFNLAPAGLFFMVVLTYVAATADLAQSGALVHQARSVEMLAQLDVMCFAKSGILTGTTVEMRPPPANSAYELPPKETISQQVGHFAHSLSSSNVVITAIASAFNGTQHNPEATAPFLSVYGWSGLVFNKPDLAGTFILADPQVFQTAQTAQNEAEEGRDKNLLAKVSPQALGQKAASLTRPFSRLIKRKKTEETPPEPAKTDTPQAQSPAPQKQTENEKTSGGLMGRFKQRVTGLLSKTKVEAEIPQAHLEPSEDETLLIFAYTPQLEPLYDPDGNPQLPANLIPLCYLSYQEQIRPEAIEAIETFSERGVGIKIFSPDPPEKTIRLLKQATTNQTASEIKAISSSALFALTPAQQDKAIEAHTIFGQVTSQQTEQIVTLLRQQGRSVGVIGDSVADIAPMRRADLALTRRSSSPAALSVADIVLLNDSPLVLSRVVDKGQKIVNGLLNVLKLYLTQVFYLLLLIAVIPFTVGGFPYSSAQGGLIAMFTLTLPAVGLSIWAKGGRLSQASLSRVLMHFTGPAAVTMALAGMAVYTFFLRESDSLDYAQLTLTYALLAMGSLLIIFISPPIRFNWGRLPVVDDVRPTLVVMAGALIFVVMLFIPLARKTFEIAPLQNSADYAIIAIAVLAWALGVRFLWLIIPLQHRIRSRFFC